MAISRCAVLGHELTGFYVWGLVPAAWGRALYAAHWHTCAGCAMLRIEADPWNADVHRTGCWPDIAEALHADRTAYGRSVWRDGAWHPEPLTTDQVDALTACADAHYQARRYHR